MSAAQTQIAGYEGFAARVGDMGFLLFYERDAGFPSLRELTRDGAWFTGDEAGDPWGWKDRAARQGDMAYGRLLNGHKGFVSLAWAPIFRAAYSPEDGLEGEYRDGLVDALTMRLWKLFEARPVWARHELTRELGIPAKRAGAFERSLTQLQRQWLIVTSGTAQRIAYDGHPYGWASMEYTRYDSWARALNLPEPERNCGQARLQIQRRARELAPDMTDVQCMRLFPA